MHLFAVLGEPIRFRIVEILASGSHLAGEVTTAVTQEFGVSRAAVSHHLRILREEGVVDVHPDEMQRNYRLRWDALDRVDDVLLGLYEKWDARTGWPYATDPLAPVVRRHRLEERWRRQVRPGADEVEPRNRDAGSADIDPWVEESGEEGDPEG
jgi:DNA-binding transcriptional ArsR family regulator